MDLVIETSQAKSGYRDQLDVAYVFHKMCLIRQFELQVIKAYEQERIPGVIYLSVGQEVTPAVVSELTSGFTVFSQHRCHSMYLAHGGDSERLRDELLGLPTGCCQGRGGSPSAQDLNIPMYAYHGLIGENIPLACGYALATRKPVVAYFGDGAAEEDYALAAYGFAATHQLPILFVCENNGLSILTPVEQRRLWEVTDVARTMGLNVAIVEEDTPEAVHEAVRPLLTELPAFLSVRTSRHFWHAGIGQDNIPEQDQLREFAYRVPHADRIETEATLSMETLWHEALQRQ